MKNLFYLYSWKKKINTAVDESSITGEQDSVRKEVPAIDAEKKEGGLYLENPFLISGSKVMEGTGEMIILAVG